MPLTQSYANKNNCTDIIRGSDGEVAITACLLAEVSRSIRDWVFLFIIVIMILFALKKKLRRTKDPMVSLLRSGSLAFDSGSGHLLILPFIMILLQGTVTDQSYANRIAFSYIIINHRYELGIPSSHAA